MKKIILSICFMLIVAYTFAQLNPIKNLFFSQHDNVSQLYDCLSVNCFNISWSKPDSSTDTLIGYKVYRNDILFAFSTDTVVACTGNSPCYYPGFFDIFPCWVTVKAIYNHDSLSSIADDSIYVDQIAIGIKEYNREAFNIFPNPTTDNLIIETQQKSTLEILNIEGQLIKTINTAEKQTTIDVENLSSGVYIIKAKTDRGIAVKKFIKE